MKFLEWLSLKLYGKRTVEWCVSSAIDSRSWRVEQKVCYDGVPDGAGWFITYIRCGSEEIAKELARELNAER